MNREKLLEFLIDELGADEDEIVDDDTPIFSDGILDSFNLVDLMAFLEREGDFRMNPMDVTLDNLNTIRQILAYYQTHAG